MHCKRQLDEQRPRFLSVSLMAADCDLSTEPLDRIRQGNEERRSRWIADYANFHLLRHA